METEEFITFSKNLQQEYYDWATNEMVHNKLPTWEDTANWWIEKIRIYDLQANKE